MFACVKWKSNQTWSLRAGIFDRTLPVRYEQYDVGHETPPRCLATVILPVSHP